MPPFRDATFQAALAEALDYARYGGDPAECREAAAEITDGDRESWYRAWLRRAETVRRGAAASLRGARVVEARAAFLRAAHHYRTAGRLLERDGNDPRRRTAGEGSDACFRTAMRLGAPQGAGHSGYRLPRPEGNSGGMLLAFGAPGDALVEAYAACAPAASRGGWECWLAPATWDGLSATEWQNRAREIVPSGRATAVEVRAPIHPGEAHAARLLSGEAEVLSATLEGLHQGLLQWMEDAAVEQKRR